MVTGFFGCFGRFCAPLSRVFVFFYVIIRIFDSFLWLHNYDLDLRTWFWAKCLLVVEISSREDKHFFEQTCPTWPGKLILSLFLFSHFESFLTFSRSNVQFSSWFSWREASVDKISALNAGQSSLCLLDLVQKISCLEFKIKKNGDFQGLRSFKFLSIDLIIAGNEPSWAA